MTLVPSDIVRFWTKVDKTPGHGPKGECWPFRATPRGNGYFCMKIAGKLVDGHRISFVLHKGELPPGLFACHECDFRQCVRPAHLFAGTPLINAQDCIAKGRKVVLRGSDFAHAKLSELSVIRIRERLGLGAGVCELAREFDVNEKSIRKVRDRELWAHV